MSLEYNGDNAKGKGGGLNSKKTLKEEVKKLGLKKLEK